MQQTSSYRQAVTGILCVLVLLPGLPALVAAVEEPEWSLTEGLPWGVSTSGDMVKAAEGYAAFARRLPDSPGTPQALYLGGAAWFEAEQEAEGIVLWRQLVEQYPESRWALTAASQLAGRFQQQQQWALALELFRLVYDRHLDLLGGRVEQPPLDSLADEVLECEAQIRGVTGAQLLAELIAAYREQPLGVAFRLRSAGEAGAEGNLLINPGFDMDSRALGGAPLGWSFQGTNEDDPYGDTDGLLLRTRVSWEIAPRSEPYHVGKYTEYGQHRGWFYQVVPVQPGAVYDCRVWGLAMGIGSGQPGSVRLGVHPAGGISPASPEVIWTGYVSSPTDTPDTSPWVLLELTGERAPEAQTDELTLFLELRQDRIEPPNVMAFDDAVVERRP